MSSADIRAVEDPISAIFELADDVNREAPKIKKIVTYSTVFIGFWLLLDFILILATIGSNPLIGIILIGFFILGIVTLALIRQLNDFFKYYAMRHNVILSVRDADPVLFVPKGMTPVDRLRSYLGARNPDMMRSLFSAPSPVVLRGRSGLMYQFDLYVLADHGLLWGLFGMGYPGYQLFVKQFAEAPRAEDLVSMKRAVEDVCASTRMPPSKVIALWTRSGDKELSEAAYDLLMSSSLEFSHMGRKYVSSMELVIENHDGTYEFIPFVGDPQRSLPRAQ
jgi:hypothetical protein